jgi:hypothetical protein
MHLKRTGFRVHHAIQEIRADNSSRGAERCISLSTWQGRVQQERILTTVVPVCRYFVDFYLQRSVFQSWGILNLPSYSVRSPHYTERIGMFEGLIGVFRF